MADKATDIQRPEGAVDEVDDLAQLDAMVSDLVGEINEAADEISRVMGSDDEDVRTASAVASGGPLSDDGSLSTDGRDPADAPAPSGNPIADAAADLDRQALDAEGLDEALERVAAELQEDLASATAPTPDAREGDLSPESATTDVEPALGAPEAPEASANVGDAGAGGAGGAESLAAEIDEELARAFAEDAAPPAPTPAPGPEATVETPPEETASAESAAAPEADEREPVAEEPEEDEAPADAEATDEAVHAVAEAIDRLLDEEAPQASAPLAPPPPPPPVAPAPEVEDEAEADEEEEAPVAAAAPAPAPASAAPPSPAPPAPKKAPAPVTDIEPRPGRKLSPRAMLVSALVVVNKPFARLPAGMRDTLGFVGLVTLFNAACLWVFLLLR